MPTPGNREVKQTDGHHRTPDHNRGLNHVGPNDGLNTAERGVYRGQQHNGDDRADVDEKRFGLVRPNAANHFVAER